MLFNTATFLYFLVIVLLIYHVVPRKMKNGVLLVASYVFYAFWNWKFCSLLALSTIVDYHCGRKIDTIIDRAIRKRYLIISLAVNLGVLGFFKYFNFFTTSFQDLFSLVGLHFGNHTLNIILPVGISFYTFQTLSYTIDIYNGKTHHTENLTTFAVYVSFFPQLVAGPIERAKRLLPQFERSRLITGTQVWEGLILILTGYIKKVLLSDQIAFIADNAFDNWTSLPSMALWEGLIIFSLQIYFDFSGYSDIARGVAKWFGIDLMVNFKQPYFSLSITEFWRRWHISLSSWLRDYLYIPLGGNRRGIHRMYINMFVTMLLGGLWHGASWTFVAWGFLHGIYLSIHKFMLHHNTRKIDLDTADTSFTHLLKNAHKICFTFFLVMITWLLFRAPDFPTAYHYFIRMFAFEGGFDPNIAIFILFMFFIVLLIDFPVYRTKNEFYLNRFPFIFKFSLAVIFSAVIVIFLFQQNVERPFIYFQF